MIRIAELNRLESELQKRRDSLNSDAGKAAAIRNEKNEEVAKLIESAKAFQSKRDQCNKKVSELKEKKKAIESNLAKLTAEFEDIQKEPDIPEEVPKLRVPIHVLRKEIKAIEWRLQTSVLPIHQEKQLVDKVANLSEQYEVARKSLGHQERLKRNRREFERLESRLRQIHGRIRRTVKESQNQHTQMIDIWNEVDTKKKEADSAHQQFLEIKSQADTEHKKLLEAREEIRKSRSSLYSTRREKEKEKERFIQEQLEVKTKVAYDKFKDGGKLSMEEFTILVEKGLI